jgi:hypothetical protein
MRLLPLRNPKRNQIRNLAVENSHNSSTVLDWISDPDLTQLHISDLYLQNDNDSSAVNWGLRI